MRVTQEQFNRFKTNSLNAKILKQNKSKYGNKKVIIDGIKFDSEKEGKRYINYKTLQNLKVISDLKLQVKFELQPSFKVNNKTIREITYIADFTYTDNRDGTLHVVDAKGYRTEVYKIKKKMFAYKYGIEIEEV